MKKIYICLLFLSIMLITGCNKKEFSNENLLYGKWDCDDDVAIVFDKEKNFEMYMDGDKNTFSIIGTYNIDKMKIEDNIQKYTITMYSNKRTILGTTYTDEYSTQYSISIDLSDVNSLGMINTVTSSIYVCQK